MISEFKMKLDFVKENIAANVNEKKHKKETGNVKPQCVLKDKKGN